MKIMVNHDRKNIEVDLDAYSIDISHIKDLESGSCEEININNSLDRLEFKKRSPLLIHTIGKLRRGGLLIISGNDLLAFASAINNNTITVDGANAHLYESLDTTNNILEVLRVNNVEIVSVKLDIFKYVIKGRKK